MLSTDEVQILIWLAGLVIAANVVAMALFVLYAKLPNGQLQGIIRSIIYRLDELADKLENEEKRAVAIQQINTLLGWRNIFVPKELIGWVIDTEVAAIRKMQKVTNTPNLHDDPDSEERAARVMRQVTLVEIKALAVQAKPALQQAAQRYNWPIKVYYHWTAGHYDQYFNDYHFNIGKDGSVFVTTTDLSTKKSHTYCRNSGAIGIAAACAYNATSTTNLGPEPPTAVQIEAMAQITAVLSKSFNIPIDIKHFMTHAEAADNMDGCDPGYEANGYPQGRYGPQNSVERWDLWVLKEGDAPGSGGDILRGKGTWYLQTGVG
ncbi:N-acetylmuramoyl-L-alanine amidase [Sporomusa aerivorans]|uniref:N-acetylmuramoyl-L-alanine amidase n=1 Tax=Sporomusa aerivorans TaxID=204936 RepID=UPI00352A94AC